MVGPGAGPTISHVDRKSTRLNSSHTVIYTLSLHDALPICFCRTSSRVTTFPGRSSSSSNMRNGWSWSGTYHFACRSEEHTSELQSHRDLHSFPTRRSSDLFLPYLLTGNHLPRSLQQQLQHAKWLVLERDLPFRM